MRIMFLAFPGARSHLYAMIPLAWALRTAGHQVVVVGNPDLAQPAGGTGIPFAVAGSPISTMLKEIDGAVRAERPSAPSGAFSKQEDYPSLDARAELEHLVYSVLDPLLRGPLVDDLVDFGRKWRPDLVIWDQLCPAGGVAARALGVPHARFLYGADTLMQLVEACGSGGRDPMHDWLSKALERFGVDADDHVAAGHFSLDLMPEWTWHASDVRYVRLRHLAFNGPVTIPDWVHERPDRPRVCVTLGVSHRDLDLAESAAGDLLDAVAGLDAEVIATFSRDQLTGVRVPDNVRAVDFVPLNALLPSCSAIIHHGGAGAFAGALEHGVPQLIVPGENTKWFGPVAMANGLEAEAAGIYLSNAGQLSADRVREGLVEVLGNPAFAENAERLRRRNRLVPTPNDIVPVIEDLAGGARSL